MSALRAALRPAIIEGTALLRQFESDFSQIPDSPEKEAAQASLSAFHSFCSQTIQNEGFKFKTPETATGSADEIVTTFSAGSGGKDSTGG